MGQRPRLGTFISTFVNLLWNLYGRNRPTSTIEYGVDGLCCRCSSRKFVGKLPAGHTVGFAFFASVKPNLSFWNDYSYTVESKAGNAS